jgi:uncharacterized membrane protein (UPF0127 family)
VKQSLLTSIMLLSFTSGSVADEALDAAFGRDVVIVQASKHACYRFDIWLALERPQQMRGLMHVREMPDTSGMLFVYDSADTHSMWMKNTYISLDIAFVRSDGSIANIETHTEPLSLQSISSIDAVTYVLELNAGVAERLYLDSDSLLIWGPMYEAGKHDGQ